jgi:hypothetical protein
MSMLKPGVTRHRPVWAMACPRTLAVLPLPAVVEYGVMTDGGENRQLRHAFFAALCGDAACVDKRVYASI